MFAIMEVNTDAFVAENKSNAHPNPNPNPNCKTLKFYHFCKKYFY